MQYRRADSSAHGRTRVDYTRGYYTLFVIISYNVMLQHSIAHSDTLHNITTLDALGERSLCTGERLDKPLTGHYNSVTAIAVLTVTR